MLIVSAFKDGVFYGQAELHGKLRLGRSADNGLVLDDAQLGVSRYHAEVDLAPDGSVVLSDLGGPNGTLVNGNYVSSATLQVGDQFAIGPYQLVVEDVEPGTAGQEPLEPYAPGTVPPRLPPAAPPPAAADGSVLGRLAQPKVLLLIAAGALLAGGVAVISAIRSASSEAPADPFTVDDVEAPAEPAAPPDTSLPRLDPPPAPPPRSERDPALDRRLPQAAPPASADSRPVPQLPVTRPASIPEVAGISRQPGEDAATYQRRTTEAADRVSRAIGLSRQGRYDEARQLLQGVLDEYPGYPAALAGLQTVSEQRTAAARQAHSDATQARAAGDLAAEAAALERAHRLDPSDSTAARLSELGPLMVSAGEKAFADGESYETFRRLEDARRAYQTASRLLPADHRLRAEAEKRLRELGK